MNIRRRLLGVVLILACWTTFAGRAFSSEAHSSDSMVLSSRVELLFRPEEGYFLVSFDGQQTSQYRALFVPPSGAEQNSDLGGSWLIGARVKVPPRAEKVDFAIIVVGKKSEHKFVSPVLRDVQSILAGAPSSIDLIRERVGDSQEELRSWEVQLKMQEENLRRLRADAEVIGNFGRIADVTEDLENADTRLRDIEKDIARLNRLLKLVGSLPEPRNLVRRERELSANVAELTEAVQSAEAEEVSRRAKADEELQEKLALVESTRYDEPEQLHREIERFRQRRTLLEKKLGISEAGKSGAPGGFEYPE